MTTLKACPCPGPTPKRTLCHCEEASPPTKQPNKRYLHLQCMRGRNDHPEGLPLSRPDPKDYLNLKSDLQQACAYVNRENMSRLLGRFPDLAGIEEDLKWLEGVLRIQTEPLENRHLIHSNVTSNILLLLEEGRNVTEMVEEAGELRGFLG